MANTKAKAFSQWLNMLVYVYVALWNKLPLVAHNCPHQPGGGQV